MHLKLWVPILLILGGISWMMVTNLNASDQSFKVNELPSDLTDLTQQIKIKGRIVAGSIDKTVPPVKFVIQEGGRELPVRYVGKEPLPDLFKDHAETQVTGTMAKDGVFDAVHLQAKCASKYEAMAPTETANQPAQVN
ncbi:MAG: cytochrome c maturation protein CcmE [Acidobacteria bacterium]|nr:cytochrome c maturation protein CcmE [Acidobacteriota bacterium]MCB9399365.1 cytochrome c maturation protein CcmE [Acidobacteriota bacterium]